MKTRDFELRLLELVFASNERLTPHLVAYRLNLPFAEAREHLDRMVKEGMLTLEMDESGNTWYEAPGVERPQRALYAAPPNLPPPPVAAFPPQRPRVVAAPRGVGVLSVLGLLAGGVLLMGMLKYLFPLLLFFGLFSLFRYRRAYRRARRSWKHIHKHAGYPLSGGCGYSRWGRRF